MQAQSSTPRCCLISWGSPRSSRSRRRPRRMSACPPAPHGPPHPRTGGPEAGQALIVLPSLPPNRVSSWHLSVRELYVQAFFERTGSLGKATVKASRAVGAPARSLPCGHWQRAEGRDPSGQRLRQGAEGSKSGMRAVRWALWCGAATPVCAQSIFQGWVCALGTHLERACQGMLC